MREMITLQLYIIIGILRIGRQVAMGTFAGSSLQVIAALHVFLSVLHQIHHFTNSQGCSCETQTNY